MIRKIISTMGLAVLGIDPMTAIVVLSMGLRRENKFKISAFVLSFAFFSIFFGVLTSTIFGTTAIKIIESFIPSDDSFIWAILEFIVLVIILLWIFKRIWGKKNEEEENKKVISGSLLKYIIGGLLFALTSFTDPTYYAVILLGAEDGVIISIILITLWFIISQFMTAVVYIANEFNFLDKIIGIIGNFKNKYHRIFNIIFNIILISIAVLLILDLGYYLVIGKYLI